MSRDLNSIITANVKRAIRAAGDPSLYRIGADMAEIMERPYGVGREMYGPDINADTARKHVERALVSTVVQSDFQDAIGRDLDAGVPTLTEHIDSREWTAGKKRSVTCIIRGAQSKCASV